MPSPLGRPVRVGVFEHDPDAFNCFRLLPRRHCPKPGAEIEIIKLVMEMLDWEWEIVDTELEFGIYNDFGSKSSEGNFTGIMGLLAEDAIDMCGLSMRITPERMLAAHFTFPIRYFQQVYIINRPPENDFRNFIFATFTTQIWLMLLVTILGAAMLRFIIAIIVDRKKAPSTNILASSVLETYGIMLKQRVVDPTAASAMVLEAVLISSMLVVSQYYQSSMNSKLTAPPTSAIPFYHQDELLTLLEKKKCYLTYYANLTLEGSSERNIERIKKIMKYNPVITHENEFDLVSEIKRGGVFFSTYDVEFLPQTISSWDRKQGLTVILDTAGIISYTAFGFSFGNRALCRFEDSKMKRLMGQPNRSGTEVERCFIKVGRKFNKALVKILPGIPQITLGPGYAHKKEAEDITVQARRTTLSLKYHLEQLFAIFGISMYLSILTLMAEIVAYHLARRYYKNDCALRRYQSIFVPSVSFVRVFQKRSK